MIHLTRVIKNTAFLYSSEIASKFFTVALTVLVARLLGSTELGKLAFSVALINIANVVSDFGLSQFLIREGSKRKGTSTDLHSNVIILRFLLTGSLFVVLLTYSHLLIEDSDIRKLIFLSSAALLVGVFPSVVISILRIQEKMENE